jgi:exodeoxyribonuclease VII large subunit
LEHHSLSELNKYIRQVIALNFSDTIWIHAEISQIKESKGNIYLDLIEQDKESEKILAKMQAMILYRNVIFIRKKLGNLLHEVLQNGNAILIRITVDFSEVYGLKLLVEDVDASYTFGQVELQRQEIIQKIEKEGFKDKNSFLTLPTVLQRIAVISSPNAAGYQDFIKQLSHNTYGYAYDYTLFPSSVQGEKVEAEMLFQIGKINNTSELFDAIVIIRGGGSKFDLSAFDSYALAKAVSEAKLPVITGIGHDIDISVLDLVSHTALKTPTAVADFLIEHNAMFETRLITIGERIRMSFIRFSREQELQLSQYEQNIRSVFRKHLQREEYSLQRKEEQLKISVSSYLLKANSRLDLLEGMIEGSDPHLILKKGFAIVRKDNLLINDIHALNEGDIIDTQLINGHFKSKVIGST